MLVNTCLALSLLHTVLAEPNVVNFPVRRFKNHTGLDKRANVASALLYNAQSYYALECELGTPPQQLHLVLDTGSSDFWVLSPNVSLCENDKCTPGSEFDSSKSSTFTHNNTEFVQRYADGSGANGTWAQDKFSLGDGKSIPNFNFAVASYSTSSQAVAGIGLADGETPYITGEINTPYQNLPIQLKTNGYISSVSYSLWLNSYTDVAGSILFGGINTGAYEGDIYTFPLVPVDSPTTNRLAIKLDSLYAVDGSGNQQKFLDGALPFTLDSGSTISTLPSGVLTTLTASLNTIDVDGMSLIKCDELASNKGGIGFVFSGVEFIVNFRELGIPMAVNKVDGTLYCSIGFQDSSLPLLGDNVLRSLYVVYDLENKEIGIAKAKTGSISTTYQEISTGIPGTKAPGYSNSSVGLRSYDVQAITIFGSGSSNVDGGFNGFNSPLPTESPSVTIGGTASGTGIVKPYTGYQSWASAGFPSSQDKAKNSGSSDSSSSGKSSKSKNAGSSLASHTAFAGLFCLSLVWLL